ncbi:MAG: EamA family transporter [Cyclobacteriaceae bacterium]
MEPLPFTLVFISIFTHAWWNYLIKRSTNKHVFTALSKLAEAIIFLIPGIYFLLTSEFQAKFLILILVAACITFLNYFFLTSAYKHGDLSLVYPISRSSIIFLPIISFHFIGERIDNVGLLAIALILIGTFVMHMDTLDSKGIRGLFRNINNRGSLFAILAALTVAGYTLWDKIAVTRMQPFLYFYLYTSSVAVFYNLFILIWYKPEAIKGEWRLNKYQIVQVGFTNVFTYSLVLTALTMSKATYVGGLRQLSIVVGALLGYKLLNERLGLPKVVGILLSLLGGGVIYFAA